MFRIRSDGSGWELSDPDRGLLMQRGLRARVGEADVLSGLRVGDLGKDGQSYSRLTEFQENERGETLIFEEKSRPSDSPIIEKVWYSRSETRFRFLSYSEARSEIVIVKDRFGKISTFLRGPETTPTTAYVEPGVECLGLQLRLGAYVPSRLPRDLSDRRDAELPVIDDRKILMEGHLLEAPHYENAEAFAETLFRLGIVRVDHDVVAVLDDQPSPSAVRTMQLRFLRSTGLSHSLLMQIQRTRDLVALLRSGEDVNDVAFQLNFYDQAHLYRSLKRFVGITARRITEATWVGSLLRLNPPDAES